MKTFLLQVKLSLPKSFTPGIYKNMDKILLKEYLVHFID